MPVEFTFIRHGQTVGNATGLWQGHTDSPLTGLGRDQAKRLGERLADKQFDLVVTSDLGRTVETASALERPLETDVRWREAYSGEWEDLNFTEVAARYPEELAALMAGEDVAIGGGESLFDAMDRTVAALKETAARVGSGSVAVVSHGMVLLSMFSGLLGTKRPSPLRLLGNTATGTVIVDGDQITIPRYNDDTHLGPVAPPHFGHDPANTTLLVIRHGETVANDEGRCQGHQDGLLNENGKSQAKQLATSLPELDAIYSSPLSRAADTAAAVATHQGLSVQLDEGLKEIGFGKWEGMTRAEIAETYPDDFEDFKSSSDTARGGNGETFAGVRARMATSLGEIVAKHPGQQVGVLSHGGATRAWATELLGIPYENRNRLRILSNTGHAKVTFEPSAQGLVSWDIGGRSTDAV